MLSFSGISLGWVTNIQKVKQQVTTQPAQIIPWLHCGPRSLLWYNYQFLIFPLKLLLPGFKLTIVMSKLMFCLKQKQIISQRTQRRWLERKIPGVCGGVRVPPPGAKIICSWAQALCSGYPWPGQLHLWPSSPASHLWLICECIYLRAWLWFFSFQK